MRCRELDIFIILNIFLEIVWKFFGFFGGIIWELFSRIFGMIFWGGIFWEIFFGRIILGGFFWGGIVWEDFLGGFFSEEFLGRNYLVEINKELMFLSRFWGNFVLMHRKNF